MVGQRPNKASITLKRPIHFVNLKSNMAILSNKSHNFLRSAFFPKNYVQFNIVTNNPVRSPRLVAIKYMLLLLKASH